MNQVIILTFLVAVAAGSNLWSSFSGESGKIIGGKEINIEKVPYQVLIEYNGVGRCGGTILDKNHILTAAHCVQPPFRPTTIRAGSSVSSNGGTVILVEKVSFHDRFNITAMDDYDVAVLKLKNDIKFDKTKQAIDLTDVEPSHDDIALISGWGIIKWEDPHQIVEKLRAVQIPILEWKKCKEFHGRNLTERMICTAPGDKTQCVGDSGGPVVVNGKVAGIVSFSGDDCDSRIEPSVQTNVYNLRKWIKDHLK